MNALEFGIRKKLRSGGGQRYGRMLVRKRPTHGIQSDTYVPFVIVRTGVASVSDPWEILDDKKSRSTDPGDSVFNRVFELTAFIHADVQSDICDDEEDSVAEKSAFIDTVYDLAGRGDEDQAIDVIFEYVNNLLVEEKFSICDQILAEVDLARIPVVLMVSFLTITAAAKTKLKRRPWFFKVVRRTVARMRGEKAADRLLDGLD